MDVTVTIPPELRRTLDSLADLNQPVLEGAAMGIESILREHFKMLQSRPRKDGLRSVGFWDGVDGKSVSENISEHTISGNTATVSIEDNRLIHRMTGGTIKASDYGHTYLTLPATDEAAKADRGARSFTTHISWEEHPDGGVRPALVSGTDRGSGSVLYWLVRSVTHKAMPDALPSDRDLSDAAYEAALDVIDALINGEAA